MREDLINNIIQGDCLEVMKSIPDGSVDLTVTSPPYDNLRDYKGFSFDFEGTAKELYRITADGGVVVWIVNDATVDGSETGTSFKQALYFKEIGFKLHDTMIYSKTGIAFPDSNRYQNNFEYMFVLSKMYPKTINLIKDKMNSQYLANKSSKTERRKDGSINKDTNAKRTGHIIPLYSTRFNVWLYDTGYMHTTRFKEAYIHPAMFPEKLAHDHIISWSNPNDIVLDPFLGSGTTAVAAIRTGRRFIGIELSEEYCKIARKRVEQELSQPVMFPPTPVNVGERAKHKEEALLIANGQV